MNLNNRSNNLRFLFSGTSFLFKNTFKRLVQLAINPTIHNKDPLPLSLSFLTSCILLNISWKILDVHSGLAMNRTKILKNSSSFFSYFSNNCIASLESINAMLLVFEVTILLTFSNLDLFLKSP